MTLLIDQLRSDINISVRQHDTVRRDILKLVLGTLQTSNKFDNDAVVKTAKKLIQANEETLKVGGANAKLEQENSILSALLPRTLTLEQIAIELDNAVEMIKEMEPEGKAIGFAIKVFKESGLLVNGADVTTVVKQIRLKALPAEGNDESTVV